MSTNALVGDYLRSSTDKETQEEIVLELTQSIGLARISLLDLVSALGDYLVETDVSIRSRSMHLLQQVLGSIPADLLSGQHVTVMTQFFCDRLTDDVCLSESLAALLSIAKMGRFAEEDAQRTVKAIFLISDDAQSHPQRTRFQIYTLFDCIMSRKRKALRSMSAEFVVGFTNLMSGEKDPRNLMLSFSIMRVILEEFDIVSHVTDLFDVVYCYFPITFRPPPDDPTSITTDDLKARLRECLCATHQFAPYLIPALIEKLNAVAVSVKKDTLLTLIGCCKTYSARILDTYSAQLWAALKFEIIQSEDGILEEVGLDSLTAITSCLTRGLTEMPKQGSLSRWLQPIVTESVDQLKEPELKSAKPCGKILRSVAIASPICLQVVAQSILPGLIAICDEAKSPNEKASLLEVLLNIVDAAVFLQTNQADAMSARADSILSFSKVEMFEELSRCLVSSGTNEVELRKAALNGLVKLSQVSKLLDDKEFRKIIGYLNDLVIEEEGEVSDEALVALAKFSQARPDLILEDTFPVLLAKLPDHEVPGDLKITRAMLHALAMLADEKVIFDTLIIRLLSRLDSSLAMDPQDTVYPLQLVSTILDVLRRYAAEPSKDESAFFNKLVPQIFQRTIKQLDSVLASPTILQVTGEIVNICTRSCDLEKQRLIAADLFSVYITGGINSLVTHADPSFRPFDKDNLDQRQLNTIALFVGVFAGLRPELDLIGTLNLDFLVSAVNLLSHSTDSTQRLALLRLVSLLVNKTKSEADVAATVAHTLSQPSFVQTSNSDVLLWLCKALVLRSHKDSKRLVGLILNMLEDEHSGSDIARGFQIIIGDDPLLSRSNHCSIKLLHKQKFYGYAVPSLLTLVEKSQKGECPNSI